jgi:hypothetical protein
MTTTVQIHEDNSGAVYLTKAGQTVALGPVTPDLAGLAGELSRQWTDGDWEPEYQDGGPYDLAQCTLIATVTSGVLAVVYDQYGPAAGGGGELFLGV